ncbi:hypothetical protein A8H36_25715 [Burkholderia thailandensis]|nr:hypothetical protein A8H36_25715 [Burkholderia thailandensis]
MQAYLAANSVGALRPDELLRAEWVARVSALDLYVHELVAQRMLAVFDGSLPKTPAYNAFMLTSETTDRIRHAATPIVASAAFDLEIRRQLGFLSYQYPDKIADGIRMCSSAELWNDVAVHQGATQQNKVAQAKQIKRQLTSIVDRRNKIAHEGDLQPRALPISPWPISQGDLTVVSSFIEKLVKSIDACV